MYNPSQGWSYPGNDEKTDVAVEGGDEVGGAGLRRLEAIVIIKNNYIS